MKNLLLILMSSFLFSQKIPEPNNPNAKSLQKIQVDEFEKLDDEFIESLRPLIATTKYGLGIITCSATGDDYSTGAMFKIYNPSNKTIKYIWFTVGGENPVGDLVGSKGNFYKTLKGIGPVESNGIAEWEFQYVWLTNIVETLRLTSIKIQYMDNSIKVLKYNAGMYIGNEAYENALTALFRKNQYVEKIQKQITYEKIEISNNDIDQQAEFPGGINALRNIIKNKIDPSQLPQSESLFTNVSFYIETDGSVSEIKASGVNQDFNSQLIKIISSITVKWLPASNKGVPIRSLYTFPFKMQFE